MRSSRKRSGIVVIGGLWLACCGVLSAQEPAAPAAAPPFPAQELPEVLTRGPVHEAFAEPVTIQNQEPVTAPAAPPPDIDEIPPAEMPQGGNYTWVPGYWAWDQDRNNYIWVSACWRVAPPGMYWVPGYWQEQNAAWVWISGFWAPTGVRELQYLPAPPALQDVEPGPAPSPDQVWVSPCWYWYPDQERYVQRSGYWLQAHPDWIWQPSHYVWTPRGYVFVQGHWDYTLEQRGVLFAPVAFSPVYLERSHYQYTPNVVLDLALLTVSLFAYPRYNHYYFGDYYDDSYRTYGIYPWFECERRHSWYDPIYRHSRWTHRGRDPHWEDRLHEDFDRRVRDRDQRPAHTFNEMNERHQHLPAGEREKGRVAVALGDPVLGKSHPGRFEKISDDKRRTFEREAGEVTRLKTERNKWETARPDRTPPAPKEGVVAPKDVRTPEPRIPESRTAVPRKGEPAPVTPDITTEGMKPRDRTGRLPEPRPEIQPVAPVKPPTEGPVRDATREERRPPPVVTEPVRKPVEIKTPDGRTIEPDRAPRVTREPVVAPMPEVRRETVRPPADVRVPDARPPEGREIRRETVRQPVVAEPPPVRITRPERVVMPPRPVPSVVPPAGIPPGQPVPPEPDGEKTYTEKDRDGARRMR